MIKAITLVMVLAFPCALFSQQSFRITGKIVDEQSHEPLQNVNIQLYGTPYGTVSDSNGVFRLSHEGEEMILSMSLLGYEKRMFQIRENNPSEILFTLHKKSDTLQGMVIQAKKNKRKKYISNTIIDYSFYGDHILTLSHIGAVPTLSLLGAKLDTLSSIRLPKKPHSIFRDCLGFNHIVYDTVIYQIFFDSKDLQLLYPATNRLFQRYLFPCVGADEQNLYFMKKYGSGDVIRMSLHAVAARDSVMDYYLVNKKTKKKSNLTTIANPRGIESNGNLVQWVKQKEKDGLYIAPNDSNAGNQSNVDELRRRRTSAGLYVPPQQMKAEYLMGQQLFLKELYAPLFVVHDSVYIFNYENAKIQRYYAGSLFDEVGISFHKEKNCKREMLMDKKTQKIYVVFDHNGMAELKEINPKSGSVVNSIEIPHPYPAKILVHDDYVYYLREKGEYINEAVLNRMKINN